MKSRYQNIWHALDGIRGYIRPSEMPEALLIEASQSLGMQQDTSDPRFTAWENVFGTEAYRSLKEARSLFLSLPVPERLSAFDEMMSIYRSDTGFSWIGHQAAKRIVELADDPDAARCAFASSLHPALLLAMNGTSVRFEDINHDVCNLARMMAVVLEVHLQVVPADPFARIDEETNDAEIIMAPFGYKIPSTSDLPKKTLEILGDDGRSRRLSSEAVALADAQVSTSKLVIVSVADGAMFRGVGVEPIAREALVESGRLRAILAVPGGMIFQNTGVASDILILSSEWDTKLKVRFVDLSAPRFAGKTVRGRPEIKSDTSWLKAIVAPVLESSASAMDVPISDIRAKDYILSLDRYLVPPAVADLECFLSERDTLPLHEAVELIRPLSLGQGDDGDFKIREASPADIGERGYLPLPKKEISIERAQLRKARNQRLMPGDVLLSVKGTVGSVALVPEEASVDGESHFWTAGQSFMILRPKQGRISGIALLEYFSNPSVKTALRSLAAGAAIQTISIKDLKEFRVPVPSTEEEDEIEAAFRDRQARLAEVRTILKGIEQARDASWPHRELQGAQA
ncbi:N-6 DNA methylase [Citreimonas salinaria]|nr:N-6 DNA methylase [Citreimonas salinaria]